MNEPCSIELLESALAGTLSPQDERTLGAHLEACAECSVRLESLAGGPAWCHRAAALLVGDELDESLPARDEWWDVDFSVEHLEPSDDPNALGRVGPYDILEIVGRGGMGVVLKGFDRELKRCVAIKVLAPHLAQSSLAKKRFIREAQAAAAIVHPNVLAIHQVQPSGRLPFLVMPFVAGESLAQRLAAQGSLELKEILRIGMQAAAGLAAAHEQGLVHRDVKPANILLEKGVERAVITDFGLARAADDVSITRLGIIAGTPQYMSPEQARGEALDGRSDLFSLGCVLYEIATGVSPFRADSAMATMRRLVDEAPQALASLNPELPPWFCAIVNRLLEKEPARRFGSAKEVSELLEGCLAHVQQPTGVPLPAAALPAAPSAPRAGRWWPFSLRFTGVLVMIATLGFGLASFLVLGFVDPPDISGDWTGPESVEIRLNKTGNGEYNGGYTTGKQFGVRLVWSRIEGRFVGIWRDADDRFGELSARLVDGELRGAYTTDPKFKVDPGQPRGAEFVWKRGASFRAIVDRDVKGAIDFETGKLSEVPEFKADDTDARVAAIAHWMKQNGMDGCFDAQSLLPFGMDVLALANEDWDQATPERLTKRFETLKAGASSPRLRPAGQDPATYAIHTREGNVGLVQVLGFADADRTALKIRYKLSPQTRPIAAEKKAPEVAGKANVKSPKQAFLDGERKILFAMNGKPWKDVIDWVADQTGLTYISREAPPEDSFKFNPAAGATISFPEVIDIINEELHPLHCLLIRRNTSFSIIWVGNVQSDGLDPNLVPRISIDELAKRGSTEVVQIVLTRKKGLDSQEFHFDLYKQLGPLGDVKSLKTSNEVLVTDQAGMLRRLMKTIHQIEPAEKPAANPVPRKLFRSQTAEPAREVAYSPDESLLAVAGDDTTVKILDAKTGAVLKSLKTATPQEEAVFHGMKQLQLQESVLIVKLVFSPDSSTLAIGNNAGQVKLFNTRSGGFLRALDAGARDQKKEEPKGAEGAIQGDYAFPIQGGGKKGKGGGSFDDSPFGAKTTTGGGFGKKITDPSQRFEFIAKGRPYFTIPESGKLSELLTEFAREQGIVDEKITRDQFLKFFAKFDGTSTLARAHGRVQSIVFSPDGATLATSGTGRSGTNPLELWDVKTGARKMENAEPLAGNTGIAFSPNSKILAGICSSGLRLFDSQSGKKLSSSFADFELS